MRRRLSTRLICCRRDDARLRTRLLFRAPNREEPEYAGNDQGQAVRLDLRGVINHLTGIGNVWVVVNNQTSPPPKGSAQRWPRICVCSKTSIGATELTARPSR